MPNGFAPAASMWVSWTTNASFEPVWTTSAGPLASAPPGEAIDGRPETIGVARPAAMRRIAPV